MKTIKELFVSYEIAVQLKEKGFDEPCFGYYTPMKDWMMQRTKFNPERHFHGPNWSNSDNSFYFMYKANSFGDRTEIVKNSTFIKSIHNVSAPLYQQVVLWFLEKHKMAIIVSPDIHCGYYGCYYDGISYHELSEDKDMKTCFIKAIEQALKLI